jgi:hypothetical protein
LSLRNPTGACGRALRIVAHERGRSKLCDLRERKLWREQLVSGDREPLAGPPEDPELEQNARASRRHDQYLRDGPPYATGDPLDHNRELGRCERSSAAQSRAIGVNPGEVMKFTKMMARRERTLLICHAIRHLLDHAPTYTSSGDVEAIDILQGAIANVDTSDSMEFQNRPQFTTTLASLDAGLIEADNYPTGALADSPDLTEPRVLGEIAIDRTALQRILRESPVSLLSMLDALLYGLDPERLNRQKSARHQDPVEHLA